MRNTSLQRVLSLILCVFLCAGLFPAFAFAEAEVLEVPTAEQIVFEEPVVEEPIVEDLIAEEPIVEGPVAEEPVAEALVVEAPVVEEPIVEGPVVEEPAAEEPVAEKPVAEALVVEAPVVEEPIVEDLIAEEPIVEGPVVEEPVVEEPVRVVFVCEPADAVLTVYDAVQTDANGEALVIAAEADGSYLLLPGDYWYAAQSEGFTSIEKQPFTVEAQEVPLEIALTLAALPVSVLESAVESEEDTPAAAVEEVEDEILYVDPPEPEWAVVDVDMPQDLLDGYADQALGSLLPRRPVLRAPKNVGGNLTGPAYLLYQENKTAVAQIAAGQRASTKIAVPLETLLDGKLTWTAEELGVSAIVVDGAFNSSEIWPAFRSMMNARGVVTALLQDCPYELYWYQKTTPGGFSYGFTSGASVSADHTQVILSGDYFIQFTVAEEYRSNGDAYTMDTTLGQEVQSAVNNAKAIVNNAAGLSTYDMLNNYRQVICDKVSYNDTAASGGVAYGNPWQLIWVFDDDNSTNVVCEGYAKAFQYLCDLSNIGSATCYTVTGTMAHGTGAGNHMWNIVTMPDGKNYLVDVTNCDSGSVGYPDKLFLKGYTSCSSDYTRYDYNGVIYTYDDNTKAIFSLPDLTLSATDYGLNGFCKVDGKWSYYKNGVIDTTYTGFADNEYGTWYVKDGKLNTMTGMVKVDGTWWYVKGGKKDTSFTGFASNAYGTWYMKDGKLNTMTGMVKVDGTWWYVKGGKKDTSFTGFASNAYGTWYMKDGKLNTMTGMVKVDGTWWYVKGGKKDTSFTGFASNAYGTWYMKDGKLNTMTGTVIVDGQTYSVVNGKLKT